MQQKFRTITISIGSFFLIVLTLSIYFQLELPRPSGAHVVGRNIFKWVDKSRPEALTQDPNDFREVTALVWYPATPGTGVRADYFPYLSNLSSALAQSGEVEWWQVLGLRFIRSGSFLDADPARTKAPFPVVLLSPGNGTNIEFYSSIASEVASHGYIVVGLNHSYDVAAVELSTGNVAPYDKDQWLLEVSAHQAYTAERIKVRTADVLFALDQLY